MNEWQPIDDDTPKGGRILVGSKPDQWTSIAYWETDEGHEGWYEDGGHWSDAHETRLNPTHWMPLPEPPK